MPIIPSEMGFYYSGGSTNSDPNNSIGGAISTTEVPQTVTNGVATNILGNLFDKVGRAASGGYTDYRIIYLQNDNTSLTAEEVGLYFYTPSPEIVVVDDKVTPNINVPIVQDYPYVQADSGNGVLKTFGNLYIAIASAKNTVLPALASKTVAPAGITFTQPVLNGTTYDGVEILSPDLDPGDNIGIYIQRKIPANSTGKNIATASLTVPFSSAV